jgi:hypothetical protein
MWCVKLREGISRLTARAVGVRQLASSRRSICFGRCMPMRWLLLGDIDEAGMSVGGHIV